jgi:phosphoribosylaminoimidazolecarboxamide formyltransferase/IMP cyclohydrolase
MDMIKIKRALISVTDKTGVGEFALELQKRGVEIISTGGTANTLREAGVKVIEVSDYTGFPEMLDGRVKTLHPKVHGGILFMRDNETHIRQTKDHSIHPIDLVVVNLYAFEKTVARPGCTLEQAVENIDIGGPALLRASAKNYQFVTVVVDPNDYKPILAEMDQNDGSTTLSTRFSLARKVFQTTAAYDRAISDYLDKQRI